MSSVLQDDMFTPEVIADPYAYYGRLRDEDPVHWNQKYELWVVTRHDDLVWLTRHHELFSSAVFKNDPRPAYPTIDESDLGLEAVAVASSMGLVPEPDPHPKRNVFIRSDQYSFIRRGIPSLMFKVGFAKGTAEEETFKAWLKDRYHAPSDDLAQPVDRSAAGAFDRH